MPSSPHGHKRPKIKRRDLLDTRTRAKDVASYDTITEARPLKPPANRLPTPKEKAGVRALRRDEELGIAGFGGYLYVKPSK